MKDKNYTGVIPRAIFQERNETKTSIELKDNNVAIIFYDEVKKRVLNFNNKF